MEGGARPGNRPCPATRSDPLQGSEPAAWRIRGGEIPFRPVPLLVGIVNVTPDSFSDGGVHLDPDAAIEHGLRLVAEGADLLDVGGESTRPGAAPVGADEELDRIGPVIEALARKAGVPVSVDTTKSEVARQTLAAGAHILNDVSALRFDPGLADLAAEYGAGLVLMHMRGEPRTMQEDPYYGDLLGEMGAELAGAAERARAAGVPRESIVVDPGIGFGKTIPDSYRLLGAVEKIAALGYPVMVGHSRKSFLDPDRRHPPAERLPESVAAGVLAALGGASLLRVHDVAEHRRALEVVGRWREAREVDREDR